MVEEGLNFEIGKDHVIGRKEKKSITMSDLQRSFGIEEEPGDGYDSDKSLSPIPQFDRVGYLEDDIHVEDYPQPDDADDSSEYSFRPEITALGRYTQSRLDHTHQRRSAPTNPEVTFKPKINPYHGPRPKNFLVTLQKDQEKRKKNMETLRKQIEEHDEDKPRPTPMITPYSQNMQFTEPVHMRLYKLASIPTAPPTNVTSPEPKEVTMVVDRYKYLYMDAKNRQEKYLNKLETLKQQAQDLKDSKKLSKKSSKLLEDQFTKHTMKVLDKVKEGTVVPTKMLPKALELMGIFENFEDEPQSKKNKHRSIEQAEMLLVLEKYFDPNKSGHIEMTELVGMFYNLFKKDVRDELEITESSSEQEKVLKELLAFTRAGLAYKKIGKVKQTEDELHPETKECYFKPKINKKSTEMQVLNEQTKRHELLFHQASQTVEKRKKKKEDIENKEIQQCTFTPQINKIPEKMQTSSDTKRYEQLYGNAKVKKVKEDSEAKELKQCTFQPKLETQNWKKHVPKDTPKGYVETISRVRGTPIKSVYGDPSHQLSYSEQYRQTLESPAVAPPMVYVDVNLGQRTVRLGLRKNDDVEKVAQAFGESFGLEMAQMIKLKHHIVSVVRNYDKQDMSKTV